MNMTTERREQARLSLLRYCGSAAHYGLATGLLLQLLRSEGFHGMEQAQLRAELGYLVDKGLITPVAKMISPENEAWRITATGRDLLASQHE
jgi:hypothetical protein